MSHTSSSSGWPTWLFRILITMVLCGILIAGMALVTLSLFADANWIKSSLIDMLETSAGGAVHIDHLELHILPFPQVSLTGLAFTSEKAGSRLALQAKHVEVVLGWDTFWHHHLVLTRIVIHEPELILELPFVREPTEPEEWSFPAIHDFRIDNGRLHLMEPSESTPLTTMTWEDIHVTLTGIQPAGTGRMYLTAQSPDQERPSSLTLQGTLTLPPTNSFTAPDNPDTEASPFKVQGRVELTHVSLGQLLSLFSEDLQEPIHVRTNFEGEFAYTKSRDTDRLALPGFRGSLNGWEIAGQGRILDLHTDTPFLTISGSTTPIAIERLKTLLPPKWLPPDVQIFLADRQVKGTLQLISGSVQGPLNQPGQLKTEAEIQLEQGRLLPAPGYPPITHLSGTVTIEEPHIKIKNIHGTMEPLTITAQQALLAFREAGWDLSLPDFQISEQDWILDGEATFTHPENASPVLSISGSAPPISLQHLVALLPQEWIPAPIRTVLSDRQMKGRIELLTGSLQWPLNGQEPPAAEGVIRLEQGHVLVDPHHPPLTHLSGTVAFDFDLARMFDVQGRIYSSTLFLQEATLEWKNSEMWVDLHGGGDVPAQDVVQALLRDPRSRDFAGLISGPRNIQGHLQVTSHLEGPLLHPDQLRILEGNLHLNHVGLNPKNGLPVTGLTGHIAFDHNRVAVHRLHGQFGTSPLQVTGQWNFQKKTRSSNLLVRSQLAASDLQALYPALSDTFSTFEGSLPTALVLSGTISAPSYRLHMNLKDLGLASPGFITKPANIPGTFDATGQLREDHRFTITHGELSLPPYKLDIKGSVAMEDSPDIRIRLQTESGTGALLPQGVILGDERLGLSTLAIAVDFRGRDWDWSTWDIQGAVESTDRVRGPKANGADSGRKMLKLTWFQHDQQAKADFSVRNLLIEKLLPPDPAPRFTGLLTLNLLTEVDLTRDEWGQRMAKGKGDLRLTDGHILTSAVLSKILSLLNVANVLLGEVDLLKSGFPVNQLTGTFFVEDGLISTKDLALKSPVMALAATGTYDLPTDRFNAIVAVSPFGAYSSLLKRIPLFGTLMEGERKGLTTALFTVKGPRTDPDVTYLPLQSLTGGLRGLAQFPLDVLKNVLNLPAQNRKNIPEQHSPD